MAKNYIRDNGIIRNCPYNVSQMSILRHIAFQVTKMKLLEEYFDIEVKCLKSVVDETIRIFRALFRLTWAIVSFVVNLITFLIVPWITAIVAIYRAKKDMRSTSEPLPTVEPTWTILTPDD